MTDPVAAEKLSLAKSKLVIYQPFYATLICNLPLIEDCAIPTMATNGKQFRYNPEFIREISMDELLFVLCHEVDHCVFGHPYRRGNRDPKRWNYAADYIINDHLVTDGIGKMPAGALFNPELARAGGNSEGVYALLPEMDEDGEGSPTDMCEDAPGGAEDQAQAESEMRVAVAQAAQIAAAAGKLSASLKRLVEDALKPQLHWEQVLRDFFSSKAKVDLSYSRPNRRHMSHELIMPTLTGERLGEVVVAVDCSGSSFSVLDTFAAELRAIHEDCRPTKVHVLYFDTRVLDHTEFAADDMLTIESMGGGGTAFSPIFNYVESHGLEPEACVVLTDLYCNDFGNAPDYPVLWISNGDQKAPWGDVIKIA